MYHVGVRINQRQFDRIALTILAGLWIWKTAEYAGRAVGLLERNLGWGFYVNFTIPVTATIAYLLFVVLKRIVRLLVR